MNKEDLKILIVKAPAGFGSPVDPVELLQKMGVRSVETVDASKFNPGFDFPWDPHGIVIEQVRADRAHILFDRLRPTQPDVPVIVVSGFSGKPNSPELKAVAAKLKADPYKADEVLFGQQSKDVQKGLENWLTQLASKNK